MENEICKRQWKCNLQAHTHTHTHSQLGTFAPKNNGNETSSRSFLSPVPSPHHSVRAHSFQHEWKNLTNDERQSTKALVYGKKSEKDWWKWNWIKANERAQEMKTRNMSEIMIKHFFIAHIIEIIRAHAKFCCAYAFDLDRVPFWFLPLYFSVVTAFVADASTPHCWCWRHIRTNSNEII